MQTIFLDTWYFVLTSVSEVHIFHAQVCSEGEMRAFIYWETEDRELFACFSY